MLQYQYNYLSIIAILYNYLYIINRVVNHNSNLETIDSLEQRVWILIIFDLKKNKFMREKKQIRLSMDFDNFDDFCYSYG